MKASAICPKCGHTNEAGAPSCSACGATLVPATPSSAGARKVVTVLFSDIIGSTELGEKLDPESYRQLIARYFEEMNAVVRRHGGRTEKFIGDAIMAVFGIPQAHEDDALRAVKAAVEMREALVGLNAEFEQKWGVTFGVRMGVNTGEVMTGSLNQDDAFVAGDTVNVAARLEQSAGPGEVLMGRATYRLVRDAATVAPVGPLAIKGKTDPLAAWRLLRVSPTAPGWARRLDSPLIGRNQELRLLQESFHRTINNRACELVALVGAAGIGKSRLTDEFVSLVDQPRRVVKGRCLPYGEGITFWPIVEVLRDIAGIGELDSPEQAHRKIMQLLRPSPDAALIGERLAALLGLSSVTPGIQETSWAVRKVLEEIAAREPLVIVFDDIHWGESTFLDLLEYFVDWIHDVPVMLVCLARPDLLEVRGGWMRGKENASLVMLARLTESDTEGLIQGLLGGAQLSQKAQARIAEVTEGNPLFIEEVLRMLVDDAVLQSVDGSWQVTGDLTSLTIPPTIQALLTARLDRLSTEERHVLERASIMGRVFWWGAVTELSAEDHRPHAGTYLQALVRKELIRPDQSELREEDAFRFTHILIRDAAYAGIPKATRAQLHEQFANWIEAKARGRAGEYEEIVGYHLEQACRTLSEIGSRTERIAALGARAAVPLASAGRRAFARGDMPAAVSLMSRAERLFPKDSPSRLELLPDLAFAVAEIGDFARMQEVVTETEQAATTSGDAALQARAMVLSLWVRLYTNPEGLAEEAFRQAAQVLSTFAKQGNERGLAQGWSLLGVIQLLTCQFAKSEEAWEQAAAHAHAAGDQRQELEYLSWIPLVVWGGPTPVKAGIRRCEEILGRAAGDRKAMSTALFTMGKFEAMRGNFDEARALIGRARLTLKEVALSVWTAGPLTQMSGWVDLLAGDPATAERDLRWGAKVLQEIGELSWLSTVAAILAEAIYAQGRYDEAEEFIQLSEKTGSSDDAYSQGLLRSVRSKILVRRGQSDEAERLARQAVAISEPTDFLFLQAITLLGLGEVLGLAGRTDEAQDVLAQASRVCERKGFSVGMDQADQLMDRPATKPV